MKTSYSFTTLTVISDSLYDTFHTISDVMFFCQILATVEVLNAAFGVVKTATFPTLIQVQAVPLPEFHLLGATDKSTDSSFMTFALLPGGWKKFYPLHHFWKFGGNAPPACCLLCFLSVECHWDFQVILLCLDASLFLLFFSSKEQCPSTVFCVK